MVGWSTMFVYSCGNMFGNISPTIANPNTSDVYVVPSNIFLTRDGFASLTSLETRRDQTNMSIWMDLVREHVLFGWTLVGSMCCTFCVGPCMDLELDLPVHWTWTDCSKWGIRKSLVVYQMRVLVFFSLLGERQPIQYDFDTRYSWFMYTHVCRTRATTPHQDVTFRWNDIQLIQR